MSSCGDEQGTTTQTTATVAPAVEPVTSFEGCVARGYPVQESYPARCVTPEGEEFVEEVVPATPPAPAVGECVYLSADICVSTPHANDVITSPLTVEGTAAGWYFEGEFPAQLLDGYGDPIAWGSAWAQGDWMTTAPVPFQATISFAAPSTATGTLVLTKSDPRGGAGVSVEIPVRFTP